MRSAAVARSSSGIIAGGIGRPMSSSAVQPKMRSEAGFQMVTVRSSVNACVASGDASTIADSSVLVRSSRASAAFRAAISDCDASSAVRRLVVARQPSASAKATRAVNDAMVMPVAVPMNRTCAGPTRTASATPTLATTTAAIDASRSCAESSEPWMSATLISGATTATAMPSGSTAPATSASTLMATRGREQERPSPDGRAQQRHDDGRQHDAREDQAGTDRRAQHQADDGADERDHRARRRARPAATRARAAAARSRTGFAMTRHGGGARFRSFEGQPQRPANPDRHNN